MTANRPSTKAGLLVCSELGVKVAAPKVGVRFAAGRGSTAGDNWAGFPGGMRLPDAEHTARRWRIHEITPDFEVEDVWAFRTPGGGPDDFPLMLATLRAAGVLDKNPWLVRFLFAVRWKLGALFGWDERQQGLAGRVESLCDRLPPDLRQDEAATAVPNTPFTMVYELHDECAIELANMTVHDSCHLDWVPTDDGEYELRMAALVKPNGLFGRLYIAAIKPFRYLIIYPALTRQWERAWRERVDHVGTENGNSDDQMDWLDHGAVHGRAHRGALTVEGAARGRTPVHGSAGTDDLAN